MTVPAWAYLNWGRWVADCPGPACTSAVALQHGQTTAGCIECHLVAPVRWPDDVPDLERVLWRRPEPANRNWFPLEHPFALAAGLPHGQTVADLEAESAENGVS
ncbi:hypothetical protein [Micromonospora peucetia]|uniref:Uncharacterized protein n=1 Tax=Micromonospora peucetia TaxID=47871 RepID=A0ABZ1EJZ3_9ACTN|nr:hypothetical protein [Micromonospora peucetia]WSA34556.1 hypothetical protein OIE14_11180 [Micromonospora peucetia]